MIRHPLIYIAVVLAALCCMPAAAQEYATLHYTNNDGLPSNTVYSLYRDSKGYLWVATDKGVARYNGAKFETFTTFDGLPDNEVYFFEEDLQHRVWLGCNNGELCYFQNDTFFSAKNKSFLHLPIKLSHMQHAEIERDSSITFSFSMGMYVINVSKNKTTVLTIPRSKIPDNLDYVLATKRSDNCYRIIHRQSTYLVDTSGNILASEKNRYRINRFTSCQAQNYIYSSDSFSSIDFRRTWPMSKLALENNYLIEIYGDGKNFFYCTGNGLVIGDSLRIFEDNKVSSITRDAYGNYWVSTLNNGIYCLNKDLDLRAYRNVYRGNVVYTFANSRNVFFATNQNELFSISADTLRHIISRRQLVPYLTPGLYESAFLIDSSYHYHNFCEMVMISSGNLLASHPKIEIARNSAVGSGCKAAFAVNGKLYMKKYGFIDVLRLNPFRYDTSLSDPHKNKIFGMAVDNGGAVWYSSITHVFRLINDRIVAQDQFRGLSFRSFQFVLGYIVGITHNNELLVINNPGDKPVVDTVANQQCVWELIHPIDSNRAIVSTNNSYMLLTLSRSAGKPKYEIRTLENAFIPLQAEAVTVSGGTLYFFSNGSVTSIATSKLLHTPVPPRLFFTRIQTNKRAYPIDSIVTIPFNESKTLRISFSRLSFGKMRSFLQYAVSKNGQYTWTDFNADELNLANPGYGDYVIMIRARTFTSGYSAPATFTLRILRPFWAQWWFIGLVIGIVVLSLTGLVLFTRRKALLATQRKNLQMELELKAIYAQINPHFIFNTLNTALMLVRKKRLDDAYAHISQFSRLLRSYMKSSRNKLITVADEIGNLTDYLELQKARFVDKFGFTIFVDKAIDPYGVKIPSLLLQPFVENALTHGLLTSKYPGRLSIEFVPGQGQGEIICRIDDNGIGRAAAREVNKGIDDKDVSYGNLLIRDLVSIFNKYEQMNIEINYIDKEEPETGTTVLISIKRPQYE